MGPSPAYDLGVEAEVKSNFTNITAILYLDSKLVKLYE